MQYDHENRDMADDHNSSNSNSVPTPIEEQQHVVNYPAIEEQKNIDIEDEDSLEGMEWSELYQDEKQRKLARGLFNLLAKDGFDCNEEIKNPDAKYEEMKKLDDEKLLEEI